MKEYTLKELWDFFPDAKWITQNKNGDLSLWNIKPRCNTMFGDYWYAQRGDFAKIKYIETNYIKEFDNTNWVDCILERPVDYSKWIGKLCWFSDFNGTDKNLEQIGILQFIKGDMFKPRSVNKEGNGFWKYCKPLTADEVKQYILEESDV